MIEIPIRRTTQPKAKPWGAQLGFGQHFTDHMFMADYDVQRGWHDARIVPYGPLSIDPAAPVLHYGQAIFEGLKALRGRDGQVRLFRPQRHCQRLAQSVPRMCMPEVPEELMMRGLLELVRLEQEWVPTAPQTSLYLRPTLIGTEPFLGVRPARAYTFFIIASPVGAYYAEGFDPVKIWIEEECVRAARGGLGAVKAGANYAASLYAAERAKKDGYAQVLWLDAAQHRFIEEVGTMNVFVQIGGAFITPPLEGSILAGVTRDAIITLLRDWNCEVIERPVAVDEIVASDAAGRLDEVFGCGTGAVISPVGEIGLRNKKIVIHGGRVGPMANRLFSELTGIQSAEIADRHGWLFPVT